MVIKSELISLFKPSRQDTVKTSIIIIFAMRHLVRNLPPLWCLDRFGTDELFLDIFNLLSLKNSKYTIQNIAFLIKVENVDSRRVIILTESVYQVHHRYVTCRLANFLFFLYTFCYSFFAWSSSSSPIFSKSLFLLVFCPMCGILNVLPPQICFYLSITNFEVHFFWWRVTEYSQLPLA